MSQAYIGGNFRVKHIFVGKGCGHPADLAGSVEPVVVGKGEIRPLDPSSWIGRRELLPSVDPIMVGRTSGPLDDRARFEGPTREKIKVHWHGIVSGYSGYAKANREILARIAPEVDVAFTEGLSSEALERARETETNRGIQVTFLPPYRQSGSSYRVIYTMMETETVHPDMIRIMNANYHECWTPTRWNAETFRRSGLSLPVHVMPLGMDSDVFSPAGPAAMPRALRLTGNSAGKEETPTGFLFIYVCQPTFRKGIEPLLDAFDEAFHSDDEAGLVIAVTAYAASDFHPQKGVHSRMWLLTGAYSEAELAGIYRASKAYVCTSRGEGWNLPMCEAASVGLPVVVPRTSVHPETVPEGHGFFFDADGQRTFPEAGLVSPWFEGIPFPDYGPTSRRELAGILRQIKANYAQASATGRRYMTLVRSKCTWNAAARRVMDRLKAIEDREA